MSKKILLTIVLFSVSLAASARMLPHSASHNRLTDIERAVYQKTASAVPATMWWAHLKKQEEVAQKMNYKVQLSFPSQGTELLGNAKAVYFQRMILLTRAMTSNTYLKQYAFKAPIAEDFVDLSEDRLQTIIGFFKGQIKPQQISFVQPFILSVSLGNTLDTQCELWIDVTNYKVYLMSNNFFTSAQTRYSLHLK